MQNLFYLRDIIAHIGRTNLRHNICYRAAAGTIYRMIKSCVKQLTVTKFEL